MAEFFRTQRKTLEKEATILVGAHVSTSISEYINLFCMSDGTSKSEVLRGIIEEWAKEAKEQYPEAVLEQMIAQRGWDGWKARKRKTVSFKHVMDKQIAILKRRGINKNSIRNITQKIKDIRNAKG